jgi:hypothetical protein
MLYQKCLHKAQLIMNGYFRTIQTHPPKELATKYSVYTGTNPPLWLDTWSGVEWSGVECRYAHPKVATPAPTAH